MTEFATAIPSFFDIYHYASLLYKNQVKNYKLEYKKALFGIPKNVVNMYNNGRKQDSKLCNVHYTQLRRQIFVKSAKSCIESAKTAVFPQKRVKNELKGVKL